MAECMIQWLPRCPQRPFVLWEQNLVRQAKQSLMLQKNKLDTFHRMEERHYELCRLLSPGVTHRLRVLLVTSISSEPKVIFRTQRI